MTRLLLVSGARLCPARGLYDSHIQKWRKAAAQGHLRDTPVAGSAPRKTAYRESQLAAENERLRAELNVTKSMLEVMGKVLVAPGGAARSELKLWFWSPGGCLSVAHRILFKKRAVRHWGVSDGLCKWWVHGSEGA